MSEPLEQISLPLISSAGGSPVRTYRWLDAARDWLASGADCGASSIEFLNALIRDGALLRTSPDFYPHTEDVTSRPSFERWSRSGMASRGGFWMLNTSDWPSDASACSLLDVLEQEARPSYFLTPRACRGILRRAARRGKELPPHLQCALQAVADSEPMQISEVPF